MEDTWWSRDLPVLDAAVQLFQEQDFVEAGELARATGFDVKDVARALRDMQGHYVGQIQSMGDMDRWCITEVTPEARRAVGQWPTPENVVDRLAQAFTAAAEHEPDTRANGLAHSDADDHAHAHGDAGALEHAPTAERQRRAGRRPI